MLLLSWNRLESFCMHTLHLCSWSFVTGQGGTIACGKSLVALELFPRKQTSQALHLMHKYCFPNKAPQFMKTSSQ